jgi:hypothetical protein
LSYDVLELLRPKITDAVFMFAASRMIAKYPKRGKRHSSRACVTVRAAVRGKAGACRVSFRVWRWVSLADNMRARRGNATAEARMCMAKNWQAFVIRPLRVLCLLHKSGLPFARISAFLAAS